MGSGDRHWPSAPAPALEGFAHSSSGEQFSPFPCGRTSSSEQPLANQGRPSLGCLGTETGESLWHKQRPHQQSEIESLAKLFLLDVTTSSNGRVGQQFVDLGDVVACEVREHLLFHCKAVEQMHPAVS